jgi:hypothetical protein
VYQNLQVAASSRYSISFSARITGDKGNGWTANIGGQASGIIASVYGGNGRWYQYSEEFTANENTATHAIYLSAFDNGVAPGTVDCDNLAITLLPVDVGV